MRKYKTHILRDIHCGHVDDIITRKFDKLKYDFIYGGRSLREMDEDELFFLSYVLELEGYVNDKGEIYILHTKAVEIKKATDTSFILNLISEGEGNLICEIGFEIW